MSCLEEVFLADGQKETHRDSKQETDINHHCWFEDGGGSHICKNVNDL